MSNQKKVDFKIKHIKDTKIQLPDDGYVVRLPKEFDEEVKSAHRYVEYSCIIKKFDSLNIYAQTVLMVPKEEAEGNPAWCQNIGKFIERKLNESPYGRGYRYFDQFKESIPNNKKFVVHREVSAEEYGRLHMKISTKCVFCESSTTIKGNENFQKALFQIPGTKNMAYACSTKCKTSFKDHIKSINGTTTKEVRKRYHKAMFADIYGYVYGIYNKKTKMWYVGKVGRSPFARWEEHVMKNRIISAIPLEDLRFEILETVKTTGVGDADIETLWNAECKWIAKYDSYENGYNIQMPTKYLKRDTIGMEDISNEELYNKIVGVDRDE